MIYLDNAATTYPKPPEVSKAVKDAIEVFGGNPGRSGHEMAGKIQSKIFEARSRVGELFGAKPTQVIFTSNCTDSLNKAIFGVVNENDTVLTTYFEHNSVSRPIVNLTETRGVKQVKLHIETETKKTIENLNTLLSSTHIDVAVLCHCSNILGTIIPIKEIGILLKAHGVKVILDAAGSAGILNMRDYKDCCDIICAPGHKALYGPSGTGVLITYDTYKISPTVFGGTGTDSINIHQPDVLPEGLESGTINTVGILGLHAGVNFVISNKGTYEKELYLISRAYEGMRSIKGVDVYCVKPRKTHHGTVLAFNKKGYFSEDLTTLLGERGFALRGGLHCAPTAHALMETTDTGAARLSVSVFSKTHDIDRLLYELYKI